MLVTERKRAAIRSTKLTPITGNDAGRMNDSTSNQASRFEGAGSSIGQSSGLAQFAPRRRQRNKPNENRLRRGGRHADNFMVTWRSPNAGSGVVVFRDCEILSASETIHAAMAWSGISPVPAAASMVISPLRSGDTLSVTITRPLRNESKYLRP